jgi:hypothetical protein
VNAAFDQIKFKLVWKFGLNRNQHYSFRAGPTSFLSPRARSPFFLSRGRVLPPASPSLLRAMPYRTPPPLCHVVQDPPPLSLNQTARGSFFLRHSRPTCAHRRQPPPLPLSPQPPRKMGARRPASASGAHLPRRDVINHTDFHFSPPR